MSELKPCPFCGSSAELIIKKQNWDRDCFEGEIAVVRCSNDKCDIAPEAWSEEAKSLNYSADTEEAIKRWNTRASDDTITEQEKVISELEKLAYEFISTLKSIGNDCGAEDTKEFVDNLLKHKQPKGE